MTPRCCRVSRGLQGALACLAIVIIGGLGSLWGALLGALIIGLLDSFGSVFFPEFRIAVVYVLLMAVLAVRPWGLFGRPGAL